MATKADYNLWGNMYFEKISDYGNWISYRMQYDELPDTLVVQNTKSRVKFKFGEGEGSFYGEKWFMSKQGDSLGLLDLATAKRTLRTGIESYALSNDCKTLVTIEKQEGGMALCLSGPLGDTRERVAGVSAFSIAPTNDAIVYQDGTKVIWQPLDPAQPRWEINAGSGACYFTWQDNGRSFAFVRQGQDTNLVFYAIPKDRKLQTFDPTTVPAFPLGMQVASGNISQLTISGDGQRVFFGLLDPAQRTRYDGNEIKIWNGNDKYFYPQKNRNNNLADWSKLAVWFPFENRFLPLGSTERPFIFFNATQEYAITYSVYEIGPQYIEIPRTNYYLTDLKTGQTRLWLEDQSNVRDEMSISPDGRYAAYFKESDWWVYDFGTGEHTNVTRGKVPDLVDGDSFYTYAFGVAGWGVKDSTLLVYDAKDIWEIDLPKGSMKRLTNGSEHGETFRIAYTVQQSFGRRNFDWRIAQMQDTGKGMLLKAVTDTTTAYYLRDRDGRLETIDRGACSLSGMVKSQKANVYLWQSETFNNPPEFRLRSAKRKPYRTIEKSNPHHKDFLWREPEMIRYTNSLGIGLKGILYYPAGYDNEKKYPMVVHIYQKQSYARYHYGIPSLYKDDGFSIQHLTAQGYFVFEPDIVNPRGEPGLAALDCVESAVKAVTAKNIIAPGKVALVGHSFGGYETDYIITRSNLFACAVSGAAITDLRAFYLGISIWLGRPEIWRMESQQWEIGKSLFDDPDLYERNCPMTYVKEVKTPLLQWAGESDTNVNPNQTVAFYVALRRLNKEQVLVTYPKEQHGLMESRNQKDLAGRIDDWFAYYLKKEPPAPWIANGIK